jgi:hypothetical protein
MRYNALSATLNNCSIVSPSCGKTAAPTLTVSQSIADAPPDGSGGFQIRLRQHHSEFIAAVTGRGIDRAATGAHRGAQPAQRCAANQMAVAIVDALERVKIEQQQRKLAACTVRTLDFDLQRLHQRPVIA